MTVAFVLQGGASLAAGQVGMLRALLAAGITPDLVIGTSAGALNAVAFAQDPSLAGLRALEDQWRTVRRQDVLPLRATPVLAALRGRCDGVVSPAPLRSWIASGLSSGRLEDAVVPVGVVATDRESGRPVVLRTGDAVAALLASSAVPGIYPSVTIGGRRLVDGGVAADLPVRQAVDEGATTTFVLPRAELRSTVRPSFLRDVLLRTLQQILDQQGAVQGRPGRVVHVLPAPVTVASNPFDFRHSARLIDDAHVLAQTWLHDAADAASKRAVPTAA